MRSKGFSDILYYINQVFEPLFNKEEIPEILFNPVHKTPREDRINEYLASLPIDELKSETKKLFENIIEKTIHDRLVIYAVLFYHDKILDVEEFELKKERIFGEEINTVSLNDKSFKRLFKIKKYKIKKEISY